MIGIVFGLATDLGLGTIQLNAGLNFLNSNIPINFWTQLIIVVSISIIAMMSVLSGTSKGLILFRYCFTPSFSGMKWLSNLNSILALLLWLIVLFIYRPSSCEGITEPCAAVGPNGSILKNFEGVVQIFGTLFSIYIGFFQVIISVF